MADITNFNVGQGESFGVLLEVRQTSSSISVPIDITDFTFRGMVRENFTTEEPAAVFNIEKIIPYEIGSIFVSLTPEQTIELTERKYVYDINMSNDSSTRRILEGSITLRPTATK